MNQFPMNGVDFRPHPFAQSSPYPDFRSTKEDQSFSSLSSPFPPSSSLAELSFPDTTFPVNPPPSPFFPSIDSFSDSPTHSVSDGHHSTIEGSESEKERSSSSSPLTYHSSPSSTPSPTPSLRSSITIDDDHDNVSNNNRPGKKRRSDSARRYDDKRRQRIKQGINQIKLLLSNHENNNKQSNNDISGLDRISVLERAVQSIRYLQSQVQSLNDQLHESSATSEADSLILRNKNNHRTELEIIPENDEMILSSSSSSSSSSSGSLLPPSVRVDILSSLYVRSLTMMRKEQDLMAHNRLLSEATMAFSVFPRVSKYIDLEGKLLDPPFPMEVATKHPFPKEFVYSKQVVPYFLHIDVLMKYLWKEFNEGSLAGFNYSTAAVILLKLLDKIDDQQLRRLIAASLKSMYDVRFDRMTGKIIQTPNFNERLHFFSDEPHSDQAVPTLAALVSLYLSPAFCPTRSTILNFLKLYSNNPDENSLSVPIIYEIITFAASNAYRAEFMVLPRYESNGNRVIACGLASTKILERIDHRVMNLQFREAIKEFGVDYDPGVNRLFQIFGGGEQPPIIQPKLHEVTDPCS